MYTLVSNSNQSITVTDVNWFNTGETYWWDRQGTVFYGSSLHTQAKEKSTNPPGTGNLTLAQTDDVAAIEYNTKWNWIVGDVRHGGIASFYKDTNDYYFIKVAVDPVGHTATYQLLTLSKTANFYMIDKAYVAGDTQNYGSGFIISDGNGLFSIGYYEVVIVPVPPVITYTVNRVQEYLLPTLPVGMSNPVLAGKNPPTTITAFTGTTNSISFSPGGEQLFNISLQAWTDLTLVSYFDWTANLDNANIADPDPNGDQGYSSTGGGDGEPQSSVDIDFPDLPPDMLINSGAVVVYTPSAEDMQSFMHFIYSSPDNIIANFKKLWVNPMESIINFGVVPLTLTGDSVEEVKFCGVGSGVSMPKLNSQYITVDCGECSLPEEYSSLLDYSSYTKVTLILPFIGSCSLNTDDVMGAMLELKYFIDLITGECVAILKSSKTSTSGNIQYSSCLYQFKGNVLTEGPLTSNNYQQLYSGVLSLVQAAALPTPASVAGVANQILGQKVTVQRAGSITGNAGCLGEYIPYLIIEKPIRSVPTLNYTRNGYPTNISGQVKEFKAKGKQSPGIFIIKQGTARLDFMTALDEEKEMIMSLLESGIIL